MKENWKIFIINSKKEYNEIGYIECPAFNNDKVYFNKHGFNHLIRKQKDLRTKYQQKRRISLIKYAPIILSKVCKFNEYLINEIDGYSGHFWSFIEVIEGKNIKVIVRKLGNGRRHFFSIMDQLPDSTKDP